MVGLAPPSVDLRAGEGRSSDDFSLLSLWIGRGRLEGEAISAGPAPELEADGRSTDETEVGIDVDALRPRIRGDRGLLIACRGREAEASVSHLWTREQREEAKPWLDLAISGLAPDCSQVLVFLAPGPAQGHLIRLQRTHHACRTPWIAIRTGDGTMASPGPKEAGRELLLVRRFSSGALPYLPPTSGRYKRPRESSMVVAEDEEGRRGESGRTRGRMG